MANPQPQVKAGGDINTARFVNLSTSDDHTVLEADANEPVFGISSEAAQDAPIPSASTLAAASGDYLRVYTEGEICLLKIGSGGCTAGDRLKSDGDGKGVIIATTGTTIQHFGAIALETAIENDLARVQIHVGSERPALV